MKLLNTLSVAVLWMLLASEAIGDEQRLPSRLGEFRNVGYDSYEEKHPGAGYSHGFEGKESIGTVYFYTENIFELPELETEFFWRRLLETRRGLEDAGEEFGYEELSILQLGHLTKLGSRQCLSFIATYRYQGLIRTTFSCLMPFDGEIIKVRYTHWSPDPKEGSQRLRRFLDYLAIALGIGPAPRNNA